MGLTDKIKRIKKSWDKVNGEGSDFILITPTNHYYMNTTNTQRERIELQTKIQRLQWLLKECIGIEEYELCSQIKAVIQRKYAILNENPKESE